MKKNKCPICGNIFESIHPKIYCSKSCRYNKNNFNIEGKFIKNSIQNIEVQQEEIKDFVKDIKFIKKGIYFIKCGKYVKIGYSNNIQRRLYNLKTANPYELTLIFTIKGNREKESRIHKLFKQYGTYHKGEWFKYDEFMEIMLILFGISKSSIIPEHLKSNLLIDLIL